MKIRDRHVAFSQMIFGLIGFWLFIEGLGSYVAFADQWEGFQIGRLVRMLIGVGLIAFAIFLERKKEKKFLRLRRPF